MNLYDVVRLIVDLPDEGLSAGAVGAVMSVLWNYAMSTLFVWRAR